MAVPPNTNEAFLREVDEELRRDQMASFWTRYGLALAVGLVAALALLGGVFYWRHGQTEAAGARGEELQRAYDALGTSNITAAAPPLAALAASDAKGYRALARFTQADILLQKNDLKGAAAKLAEIAGDTSLAQPFRDLALIRQTSAEFDTLKPDVVVSRLAPLAVKGNPWFGSAGELVAVAYLQMNKNDRAGAMFGAIAGEESVPPSIRQRAVQMAGVLGVDAIKLPEEKNTQ